MTNTYKDDPAKGLSKLQKELLAWIYDRTDLKHPTENDMGEEHAAVDYSYNGGINSIGITIFKDTYHDLKYSRPGNSKQARSRAIRRLEERGLIWRIPSTNGKTYTTKIKLTPRGFGVVKELVKTVDN